MNEDFQNKMNEAVKHIRENYDKVLDDWCQAYMAQIYKEKGSLKPGDFTLNMQQGVIENGKIFNRYWFTLKEQFISRGQLYSSKEMDEDKK